MSHVTCHILCITYHRSDDIITKPLLRPRILQFWDRFHHPLCVTCHMTYIMYRMSPVTYHMSHVTCSFFGGEGGRAKLGVSSGWRVCHPLGTPRLVFIRTTIVVYCNSIDSVENLKSAKYFRFSKISNFYIFEIRTFIIHTFAITPDEQLVVWSIMWTFCLLHIKIYCCVFWIDYINSLS